MRRRPFESINPKTCLWGGVPDVINPTNFFENRTKRFGASGPRSLAFPIDFAGRPYNTHTTVWGVIYCHCQKLVSLGFVGAANSMALSSFKFSWWAPKDAFWNWVRDGRSRLSMVVDFGASRKLVRNFLLVIGSTHMDRETTYDRKLRFALRASRGKNIRLNCVT